MKANLAFLLHMHQPSYVDPSSGTALLPWVRLHGARGYLDVTELLEEYEHVHLTVNFVPSLVAQLEGVVAGARDSWLDLAERPIADLNLEERAQLLGRMFSVHWGRCVEPRPRYKQLLEKRGREAKPEQLVGRVREFS